MTTPDPVALAQALIRCPSVTPEDAGAIAVVEDALKALGFDCHRLRFEEPGTAPIENLYARIGDGGPRFCFAGHTDVVPPGDASLWYCNPFGGEIHDGALFGRGATDMKTAIACFIAAAGRHLAKDTVHPISLLITGDEEAVSINGTRKVLEWMREKGERIDHCIVGEPTSAVRAGDTIKIGRRGSMNVWLKARGAQGHSAYPQRALNPIPILARLVARLAEEPLDSGTAHFEPSTLVFTGFDVGNPATNVIPAEATARLNIRFNDLHTAETLLRRIETAVETCAHDSGAEIAIESRVSGDVFVTPPGEFVDLLARAASSVTGMWPQYSTGGGTSDARFIKSYCPVAELGLPGETMHKAGEHVALAEIARLTDIYEAVLALYFTQPR